METLTVPVSDHPLHEDEEADQMGDEPMDTAAGGRGDEMCQMSGSLDDEHVALSTSISQLLELPHHGEDVAAVVPPDPPDLSPGVTHKVNGAVVRRVSYHGAAGKHALRQQARRRRRNTSIAAGNSPPITRVTMKTVAATSPNPAPPQPVQPTSTTTTNTTPPTTTITTSSSTTTTTVITLTTSAVTVASNIASTLCSGSATVVSLLPQLSEACTASVSTTPSPPICRISNKMAHSPNQLSGTRVNNKTCLSSTYHPVLGTRVSSRIANNAATSGLNHLNSGSPYLTSMTQSGAFPNMTSGIQASRVVRIPACQSSPSSRDASSPSMTTMQTYLAGIPGFKPRKRSQRKLSAAAQLAQTKEGNVDLETPDSILAGVNVRAILNKHTFSTLPPAYQHRLIQLLPLVDQAVGPDDALKLSTTSLNNEFFGRACESWRCRLGEGEFTHDNQIKLKVEAEKERTKLDPWKVAHFEPLWGVKQPWCSLEGEGSMSSPSSPSGDTFPASPPDLSCTSPAFTSNFTPAHMHQLSKVIKHIANRDQRRAERRATRRALRQNKALSELNVSSTGPLVLSSTAGTSSSSSSSASSSSSSSSSPFLPRSVAPRCSSSPASPFIPTSFPSSITVSPASSSSPSVPPSLSSLTPTLALTSATVVSVSSSVMPGSVIASLSSQSSSSPSSSSSSSSSPSSLLSLPSSSGTTLGSSAVLPDPVLSSAGLLGASLICHPVLSSPLSSSSSSTTTTTITPTTTATISSSSSTSSSSLSSSSAATVAAASVSASPLLLFSLSSSPSASSASAFQPDSSSALSNPLSSPSAVLLPVSSSVIASPVCVMSTSASVTPGSVTLIPSKSNLHTLPIGNSSVIAVSDKNAMQTQIMTIDQGGISVESSKRKEPLPVAVSTPSKKLCVANPDPANCSVPVSGSTVHFAQKKPTHLNPLVETPHSKVPVTTVIGSLRTSPNGAKVLTSPAVSQTKSLCSGKPAAVLLATSSSQSFASAVQPPSSPASRTSPGMRVSPGPSPSPSRLSPVVQVVSPSLAGTLATSPTGARTVVVTGPSKTVEVETSVGQGLRSNVQTASCSSAVSGTQKIKTVKSFPPNVPAGGTMTVKLTKSRTPGVVNIQRSYEIVQAVIANSPNRDQLQAQLKSPASLLAEVKPSTLNNPGVNSTLVVNSTSAGISTPISSAQNHCNSNLVMQTAPQLQTITVVKAVATNSSSSSNSSSNSNISSSSSNNSIINNSSSTTITPVQAAQVLTSVPRTMKQMAVTIDSTSGSVTPVQGVPTSAGALVLRHLMTPQLATSQPEGGEGTMAPPVASTRPITIFRPAASGRPIVVRMPVSGLQVLRLGSRANTNGECNSGGEGGGGQQQQQQPPRAASAPPNKSGVMVALSPRPSSVGPRIVVQTSNAQVSPASILSSAGHFLSEGDPSSGVSSCDNSQFVTTRAGASESLVISSDNSVSIPDNNHSFVISTANSVKRPAVNVSVGLSVSGAVPPSTTCINTVSSSPCVQSHSQMQQNQQPVSQQPLSQHSNAHMRSNIHMNNMQHVNNFQHSNNVNIMQSVSSMNMQPGNNVQSMGNMQQLTSNGGINGMAMTGPVNQMFSSVKNDTSEEGCPCNMKAMIICMKCGAFCHHDCIGPARLCVACLIR